MEKIPFSADLEPILSNRFSAVQLVDSKGKVIGTFVPRRTEEDVRGDEPWPTGEELEAMANEPNQKWYTTEEVLARLRSIG
jgi:hypothetical protein